MFQISPVVTGTLTDFLTRLISSMRSSTFCSPRNTVSLPTTTPITLLLRLARLIAASISRSLRSTSLSIQAPDRDLEAELGGDRRNQFDAFRRRVEADRPRQRATSFFRSTRIFSALGFDRRRMTRSFERRIGDAWQDAPEIGRRCFSGKDPTARRELRSQTAERRRRRASATKPYGAQLTGKRTRPLGSTDTAASSG